MSCLRPDIPVAVTYGTPLTNLDPFVSTLRILNRPLNWEKERKTIKDRRLLVEFIVFQ